VLDALDDGLGGPGLGDYFSYGFGITAPMALRFLGMLGLEDIRRRFEDLVASELARNIYQIDPEDQEFPDAEIGYAWMMRGAPEYRDAIGRLSQAWREADFRNRLIQYLRAHPELFEANVGE
jgi:hypothetical protein